MQYIGLAIVVVALLWHVFFRSIKDTSYDATLEWLAILVIIVVMVKL